MLVTLFRFIGALFENWAILSIFVAWKKRIRNPWWE